LLVQRAHEKYSFSHLTLHEYLAACHYANTGRSREIATRTLKDDRRREIQLLLAGLQVPDADAFLLAMASATAEQVRSQPLEGALYLVGQIVAAGSSPQQTAARRAFMVGFILSLGLVRVVDPAASHMSPSEIYDSRLAFGNLSFGAIEFFDIAGELDHSLSIDLSRNPQLSSVLSLARNLAHAASSELHQEVVRRLQAECLMLSQRLENWYALTDTVLRRPKSAVQDLLDAVALPPLPNPIWDLYPQECRDLPASTQRILECREAAERVTQAGWDRVCERLLTLAGHEHQRDGKSNRRGPLEAILGWLSARRNSPGSTTAPGNPRGSAQFG
jgi:hypothetical protein